MGRRDVEFAEVFYESRCVRTWKGLVAASDFCMMTHVLIPDSREMALYGRREMKCLLYISITTIRYTSLNWRKAVDVVVFFQFWRFRKYTAITRNDLTRLVCFLPMLLAFVLYVGKVDIS